MIVADDWWEWRASVIHAISVRDDIELAGEAATAEEALLLTSQQRPHVVLADLELPAMNGVSLTTIIRQRFPDTAVLIFTIHADERLIVETFRAGASGYLVKGDTKSPERLCEAIRVAAEGGVVLTHRRGREIAARIARRRPPDPRQRYPLTQREWEVLGHIAQGASNRDIAHKLEITEQSTKNHVRRVLSKLDVRSRTEAAALAHREHLLHPELAWAAHAISTPNKPES